MEVRAISAMFRHFVRRYFLLILLAGAAAVFVTCAVRLSGMAADDAFIHRRIAFNFQHYGKPYFNPDQQVMVTSSPLWTWILAAGGAALPVENPVPWFEFVFVLTGAAAAYQLVRSGHAEGLPGLFLSATAFIAVFVAVLPSSMAQMETPCAVSLMLMGCLGILQRRDWGMPVLVLACFARCECVLLLLSAALWVSLRRQWTKWSLVISAATALAGFTWLLREYGTVIPNTVIAKSHLYLVTHRHVARAFASFPQAAVCLAAGLLWWFYGRDRGRAKDPAAGLLFAFGVLLAAAYVARRTFIFPWYLPLVLVPVPVAIVLWTERSRLLPGMIGTVFAAAVLLPLGKFDIALVHAAVLGVPGIVPGFPMTARVDEYRRIGSAVYSQCPSGTLMTSEIGGLGWGFPGEIRDGAGLASPEAIHYHPMRVPEERSAGTLGEIPAGFVRDRHPDLIVSYDILAESALPAARSLGYEDFAYPIFVKGDRAWATALWNAHQMHVLVAPDGRCSAAAVDRAVRTAIERQ
jgi:hypothetical protein